MPTFAWSIYFCSYLFLRFSSGSDEKNVGLVWFWFDVLPSGYDSLYWRNKRTLTAKFHKMNHLPRVNFGKCWFPELLWLFAVLFDQQWFVQARWFPFSFKLQRFILQFVFFYTGTNEVMQMVISKDILKGWSDRRKRWEVCNIPNLTAAHTTHSLSVSKLETVIAN